MTPRPAACRRDEIPAAVAAVIAARLQVDVPGLTAETAALVAHRAVDDLAWQGWHITPTRIKRR